MLEIEENLRTPKYFLGSGLMRNIYIRYHICYMRIKSRRVSLERWFDVKYYRVDITATAVLPHTTCIPGTCHSPKYRYVIVTVVYFFFLEMLKNVNCKYDRWVVETQLRKLAA